MVMLFQPLTPSTYRFWSLSSLGLAFSSIMRWMILQLKLERKILYGLVQAEREIVLPPLKRPLSSMSPNDIDSKMANPFWY